MNFEQLADLAVGEFFFAIARQLIGPAAMGSAHCQNSRLIRRTHFRYQLC
jgi:hypothetical protein